MDTFSNIFLGSTIALIVGLTFLLCGVLVKEAYDEAICPRKTVEVVEIGTCTKEARCKVKLSDETYSIVISPIIGETIKVCK